ncbi:MAG: F0F1 ATP synthase subunit B [Thermodesulfobacteriota bacterium]|jgi:F-type H+-transporting ATPase subunit b
MTKFFLGFWFGIFGILSLAFSANDLWAAGDGDGITGEVFWQIISFVLLLFLLTYFLKNPVRTFLKNRREGIKNSLEQSAKKEEESQKEFENWEDKFNLLRQEVADLHQKISQEGKVERKRIIARAEEEGDRIRQQAQVVAEQEVKKARAALRKEMVDLSVELAEKLLKEATQPQDQGRLVREYIGRMKEFR